MVWDCKTIEGKGAPLRPMARGVVVLLVLLCACNQGSSVGARQASDPAKAASNRTVESQALMQKGGLCDENRRVSNPEQGTAEWVIYRLYELALGPDDEASFKAFVDLFPTSRNPRELHDMYWGHIRTSVSKFTPNAPKADYVICRSIATDEGRKYYIATSESRQTPPPITVGEVEGRNKILFLTPF